MRIFMPAKIMIDAGHGGYDAGATYQNRREKDDNLRLALAVGEILQQRGYDVEYTRTTDVYDSPIQKARIANDSGADFFVSIHRNSSPTENQYSGVQTLVYDDTGIKADMARNINDQLEKVGFRNINVSVRPNLAVLKRTAMPAVMVEAGFINSDVDNNLFDTRFNDIAAGIADGVDETLQAAGRADNSSGNYRMASNYGYNAAQVFADSNTTDISGNNDSNMNNNASGNVNMPMDNNASGNINMPMNNNTSGNVNMPMNNNDVVNQGYQILIGVYRGFGPASYQMNRLINDGYIAEIFEDEGLFQVRVGEYNDIEEALIAQRELRDRGYDTLIVRSRG